MKTETKRYLTRIKFKTNHFLANLLAINKICGITPISRAKEIVRHGEDSTLNVEIHTKLSTDDLISKLEEYEIEVTITNQ